MSYRIRRCVPGIGRTAAMGVLVVSFVALAGAGCGKVDAKPPGPAAGAPAAGAPAADGPSAAAALAAGKLAGLYVRQRNVSLAIGGRITFNLVRDFYCFFPDGHVLFGVPPASALKEHPTAEDFAALKALSPEQVGTYAVKGGEITFTPVKGQPTTEPFSVPRAGDDSVLQIGEPSIVGSVKALPFQDGQKLDGSYQFDGTTTTQDGNTVFSVKTLTFHPDGSLTTDLLSGVDTTGVNTRAGNSGVTAGGNTNSKGTYRLSGYTLETTQGGKTEKLPAFRWAGDDASAPGLLWVAGRIYSWQDAKK